jgi:adenine-specific DNA-methyltransferase
VRGEQARDVKCDVVAVNGHSTRVPIGTARPPVVPDLPWPLPRDASDGPLVRRAASLPARLSDYGWKVSTGPLVWNRAKDRISARPRRGSIKIIWAADLDGARLTARGLARHNGGFNSAQATTARSFSTTPQY